MTVVAQIGIFSRNLLARVRSAEAGATAIEYALIAAMISVACIAAFSMLGNSSSGAWGTMANKLTTAMQK